MFLFAPGQKEFAPHVGVKFLSGEKPKSTLLTMKCCVIKLGLLTAGEKKNLWLVTQSFFEWYGRSHSGSTCALEIEEELLSVCSC